MTSSSQKRGLAREFVALVKPRITVLSVATCAAGLWLAPATSGDGGGPPALLATLTLLGTLFLVGAANTLNMYIERDVDGLMERTKNRPLPAGRLAPRTALGFGLVQAALALPLLGFGANLLTCLLGALALFLYVLVYTPLKRRSTVSLLVGAVPGAMPPLLGWTAATGSVSVPALALFFVIFFWQVPHFIAIAFFRREDYVRAGIKILPVERGDDFSRRMIVQYLVYQVAVTLLLVPLGLGGTLYLVGAVLLGAAMLALGIYGLFIPATTRWARGLFLASIAYLPLLFGLLVSS